MQKLAAQNSQQNSHQANPDQKPRPQYSPSAQLRDCVKHGVIAKLFRLNRAAVPLLNVLIAYTDYETREVRHGGREWLAEKTGLPKTKLYTVRKALQASSGSLRAEKQIYRRS